MYSIFKNTMVDMTYPQIEDAILKDACVLLPVSVVEEHGPHLCTGTDIYLTQTVCEKIQQYMSKLTHPVVIAPPFYWGINSITNGFVGSYSIKPETMATVLIEILENLKKWGFKKIFLLNFHGDFLHIKTIIEVTSKVYKENNINAYFVCGKDGLAQYGFSEDIPNLVTVELDPDRVNVERNYPDFHAGANETSWMAHAFPDLFDPKEAQVLKPTNLGLPELKKWLSGGNIAKSVTPDGYCGNPANINLDKISIIEDEIVTKFSNAIINTCTEK